MLKGELGVGKTTFARFIINKLYSLNNLTKPNSINSPTYPILITYNLRNFEIHHYDLYRIKNIKELEELDFFENIKNTITLIEWPELLFDSPFVEKYYLINFDLYSDTKRIINIKYFE
jgi:ATPase, YjeE family